MDFKGKTAIVTGAATGIGRATAIMLAQNGANIVAVDIEVEKLAHVKAEIEESHANCLTIGCDIRNSEQVEAAVKEAHGKFGHIDILVNNAAIWRYYTPFTDTPLDEWKHFIDVNVMGTVHFMKAALPFMIEAEYGRIINVASVAGVYGNANMACYSTTKGAVIAMTKAIAKEVAGRGITINAVSPGTVSPSDEMDMDYTQPNELSYMGRTGSDNENAALICFLASKEAAYISGQNILIDGCRKRQ